LSGKHHFPADKPMQLSLEQEGIEVKDDQIIGFEQFFWDPQKELDWD
jgi:methylated-DNA-protein-cysteine methyltransferase-like protein